MTFRDLMTELMAVLCNLLISLLSFYGLFDHCSVPSHMSLVRIAWRPSTSVGVQQISISDMKASDFLTNNPCFLYGIEKFFAAIDPMIDEGSAKIQRYFLQTFLIFFASSFRLFFTTITF